MTRSAYAYGRVAVVMGGRSSERQVSLWSGQAVVNALKRQGVAAEAVDGLDELLARLARGDFDRVFNILHGKDGEDGVLQGALDAHRVPYTGSGVLGASLSMDKWRAKQVFAGLGLPTPAHRLWRPGVHSGDMIDALGLPLIVKPVAEGSTFGVSRVYQAEQLADAVARAAEFGQKALIEQLIEGPEYTVAILDGMALPAIEIRPRSGFYDFHGKYLADDTEYLCPAPLPPARAAELAELSLRAFDALGCAGWGRVDVMANAQGSFQLLEVNTAPGMTDHSLVPKAAAAIGLDFDALVLRILDASMGAGAAR